MITEDIDITWKLQLEQWLVFFEPRALCWILMPETIAGLWKQRVRWAQGGAEVFLKYLVQVWRWKHRRLWPVLLEFCLSTCWAFALAFSVLLWAAGQFIALPHSLYISILMPPSIIGLMLAMVCLLQFAVSILIDHRYEPTLAASLYWIIWYPFAYWTINLFTTLFSFPKVMLRSRRQRARWTSPDRGIKELT